MSSCRSLKPLPAYFLIWMLLGVGEGNSQNLAPNNWFYGNDQKVLLFNKSDGQLRLDSIQATPFGIGGSAVVNSYFSGDFFFYSDGVNLYDASHQIMPGASGGLSGNASINQPAAVAPVPSTTNSYYIITNTGGSAPNQVEVRVVDMGRQGNFMAGQPMLGDVEPGSTVIFNTNAPAEAMIVIEGDSLLMNWLLIQDAVTTEYRVYAIGANSNFTLASTLTLSQPLIAANFSYSPASNKVAVAPKDQNRNVHILDFNTGTGALSLDTDILNSGNADFATEAIYDTEWSLDGGRLYISRHGGSGNVANVFQVDLADTLQFLNPVLSSPVFRSYGLKLAPDSSIYHLYQNSSGSAFLLGRIDSVNNPVSNILYDPSPLGNLDFNGKQFPEFSPPHLADSFMTVFDCEDLCMGNPTKFYPTVTPQAESYFWNFGDGNSSDFRVPIHTYDMAGSFQVTLTVRRNGKTDQFMKIVTIMDPMAMLDLGADTTICFGEMLVLDPDPMNQLPLGTTFRWNDGSTGQTLTIDQPGLYWVAADIPGGCILYAEKTVSQFQNDNPISNFWYFGALAGIDFNQAPPQAVLDSNMDTPEGTATVSDANGDLIMYTNGSTVFDKDHNIMTNGTNIGGDALATQSSIIVQFPNDDTYLYIFTTEEIYGTNTFNLNYAVVDIKQNAVIQKGLQLFANSTERVTAFGSGGNFVWLIAHEYGNNTFRAYPITEDGIGEPVLSSAGSIHSIATRENGEGYMKISAMGTKLGVALPTSNANYVEVFDFNMNTGDISECLNQVDLGKSGTQQVYGIEFSPQENKIFASLIGSPSSILEFRVDTCDVDLAEQSIRALTGLQVGDEYGAIQIGPDFQTYVAVNNSPFLATINANDSINPSNPQVSTVNPNGFDLNGRNSMLGLPNFIQNLATPPMAPSMSLSNACAGDSVMFTATGVTNPSIDEFSWSITLNGVPVATSNLQDPSFVFDSAGVYDVTMVVSNRCTDTLTMMPFDTTLVGTFEIFDAAPNAQLPQFALICGQFATLVADTLNDPTLNYRWSTGETTRTIMVSRPGSYTVFITTQDGCTSPLDTVDVFDGNPLVTIGQDQAACLNSAVTDLDAGNPGAAYVWFLNEIQVGTVRTQSVNTTSLGAMEYRVEVTDSITGCTGRDTIVIQVTEVPTYSAAPFTTSGCGISDGRIVLSGAGTSNYQFLWSTGSNNPDSLTMLPAGTYSVDITDVVTGCVQTIGGIAVPDGGGVFGISQSAALSTCFPGSTIGGVNFSVEVTVDSLANLPLSYILVDQTSGGTVGQGSSINTRIFTASAIDIPPGPYTIEITDSTQCVSTDPVTVSTVATVSFQFAASVVNGCEIDGGAVLEVTNFDAGSDFQWSTVDGSFGGTTNNAIAVAATTGTYTVVVSNTSGVCDSSAAVQATVAPDPDPVVSTTDDDCDGQLIIDALDNNNNGSNTYTYIWNTGEQTMSIAADTSGTYQVTLRNQQTGCTGEAEGTFNVEGALDVIIDGTPQCSNQLPVELTANVGTIAGALFEWSRNGSVLPESTPTIEVTIDGDYQVIATDDRTASGGTVCTSTANLTVLVDSIQRGELELSEEYCSLEGTLTLDPGVFAFHQWSTGATTRTITLSETAEPRDGLFLVDLFTASGCLTSDTTFVTNDCRPRVVVPNAFAPSSSISNNQVFRAFLELRVDNFEIFIYNRWGELVFHSTDQDFQWNGLTVRGIEAPTGTYAYTMKYESTLEPELGVVEQQGGVVLVR